MDNIYKFKAKTHTAQLKQVISAEQRLQFYSEEEGESCESTQNTPKDKHKTKPISTQNGYQTDDSDGGTPKNTKTSHHQAQKMSRFSSLVNTKKVDGDCEQDPDFSDNDNDIRVQVNTEIPITNDHYNIEAQAQKLQEKLSQQAKQPKLKMSQSQQVVNSDNEQIKKNKQDHDKDKLTSHPFRQLIFGPQISEQNFKKYLMLTQRGLIYAKKCLKGPSDKFIKSKQVALPEANPKKDKTLILDLDETLIHSCPQRENPQVYVSAYSEFGEEAKIGINVRPYVNYFLQQTSEVYTIYVYTASSQAYAQAILTYIDPTSKYISGMLTRNNCMETKNGFFIKDLRIISNKEIKNMLIVDNLAHSFGFQLENGIPILEWHNDTNDQELKYLAEYLIEAAKCDDVRQFNKKLKLDDLINFNIDE